MPGDYSDIDATTVNSRSTFADKREGDTEQEELNRGRGEKAVFSPGLGLHGRFV